MKSVETVTRARSGRLPKTGKRVDRKAANGAPAGFVEPMKCRLVDQLPSGPDWVYEIKFDGFRGLAIKNASDVQLLSRNNNDLADKFPSITRALKKLPAKRLLLDGEIVALDEQGRSSFQLLQSADEAAARARLFYYAFDILNYEGQDTTGLPLLERKALLKKALGGEANGLRISDFLEGDIAALSGAMQNMGLEGLIAKRRPSTYEPGARSGEWVKFKWGNEQEFVIGGYTDPEGSRPFFGSVLVGYYQGERLIFAAKVGTGFDTRRLKSLYEKFQTMRRERTPFANLPERGGHLTAGQMRFCQWVEPRLVCQIRFTEWTRDGHLRHPVFLGLRDDKSPREVTREVPQE